MKKKNIYCWRRENDGSRSPRHDESGEPRQHRHVNIIANSLFRLFQMRDMNQGSVCRNKDFAPRTSAPDSGF